MKTAWQRRMQRAEELAAAHPFAAEMLRFYARLAGFQEKLYRKLQAASISGPMKASHEQLAGPAGEPELLSSFREFLSFIQEAGPQQAGALAAELKTHDQHSCGEFLNQFWSQTEPDSSPGALLARAFLQPYAELLRHRAAVQWPQYSHSLCPFCNRKAGAGILRQMGDGGQRSLLCSFCLAEWNFRRIVCPSCGEENNAKLPVYTAGEFDYVRVECCDTCYHYLKTVDLTKNGLADPVVDEIAAAPLDMWARKQGYSKIESNLVGV